MNSLAELVTVVAGVLVASCFVKIFTILSIFRAGIGLWQWEFGVPMVALTLALTAYVMEPYLSLSDYGLWSNGHSGAVFESKISPFLKANIDQELWKRFGERAAKKSPPLPHYSADVQASAASLEPGAVGEHSVERSDSFGRLLAVFVLSQLRSAFEVGIVLLVPLVVVDLVVINLLMLLGITTLNAEVISFPLKLLLFFSVDGWSLLAGKLLEGY